MCGIFALWLGTKMTNIITEKQIEDACNKINKRGPDNSKLIHYNYKHRTEVAKQYLGFHRLQINGLDEISNQPFEIDGISLICNGEIYNYADLAKEYNIKLTTNSDCEVIVHLYKILGIQLVTLLDGVFSFILIDRNKNITYAARDPIGVRPLFYQMGYGSVSFASEAKSLVNFCKIPYNNDTISMGEIKQLSGGHYIEVSGNKYHQIINNRVVGYLPDYFYEPQFKYDRDNAPEITTQIRELLESAVKKRLMSDRPIGCLLSGGVDSSIIAAVFAKYAAQQNKTIKTFSIGFSESTDIKYARVVAKHIGSEHHEVMLDYNDAIRRIPDVIRDTETYDITTIRASVGMYLLSEYISKNFEEIVILSGEGSDELFAGYLYFHYAPTPQDLDEECKRRVLQLPYFDVLRADRTTASHGLELRVPFLDKKFVKFCFTLNGELKSPQNNYEKYYLRKAFEDLLPPEIIWRRKEGFSDGVGGIKKPWYMWIQEWIEHNYPDDKILKYQTKSVRELRKDFPSKEAWYYYYVFTLHYKDYLTPIPHYWMPKWQDTNDPSGRMMKVFSESDDSEQK